MMESKKMNASNKRQVNGNGNSVINNHEYKKNTTSNYVSGDLGGSSSSHNFSQKKNQ